MGNGSALRCIGCTVEDHGTFNAGILVTQGSELSLSDSQVEAFRGVHLTAGSQLSGGIGSTIIGLPWALRTRGTASVQLTGAALEGRLDLRGGAAPSSPGSPSRTRLPPAWCGADRP